MIQDVLPGLFAKGMQIRRVVLHSTQRRSPGLHILAWQKPPVFLILYGFPDAFKIGSVGLPVPGTDVKIAEDRLLQ